MTIAPPEADMCPDEYIPLRSMTEAEAEWFADWLWQNEITIEE